MKTIKSIMLASFLPVMKGPRQCTHWKYLPPKICSSYLELRFGRLTRLLASMAFSLQMVLYMGLCHTCIYLGTYYIYHIFLMNSIKAQKHKALFFLPNLTGIVLYAPALALSAVTGLHFEGAVIGIGDISSYIISLLSIMIYQLCQND